MKLIALGLIGALALAGCTTVEYTGPGIEPIPGSITYGGQPKTGLAKAPPGSTLRHLLKDEYGRAAEETYIIQPDRSLRLVRRESLNNSR